MLRVSNLIKRFGGITAVNDCSFDIEENSLTGLIGPNGSGKTTVFNMISGFHKPDSGDIYFKGDNLKGQKPHEVAQQGIGRTFQITRVLPKMTVLENMVVPVQSRSFWNLFKNRISEEEEERALELLEFVGLEDLKAEFAGNLSFGQQRLLEFVSTLMADPDLILLDEIASGVNPVMIKKMMDYIRELKENGKTFLIVEHDMKVIMSLCDRIIVLNNGGVIAEGSPEDIQRNEKVLDAYLGAK